MSKESSLSYLKDLLDSKTFSNRTEVAKEVCRKFKFYAPRGQEQISGCTKALRILEAVGYINLPAPTRKATAKKSFQRLNTPVPLPANVPSTVNEIQGLKLILVQPSVEIKIWNELMIEEHPLGAGFFVGRQLRYLVNSSHGYLGGSVGPILAGYIFDTTGGYSPDFWLSTLVALTGLAFIVFLKPVKKVNGLSYSDGSSRLPGLEQ